MGTNKTTDNEITDFVRGTADVVDVEVESSELVPRVFVKQAKAALTLQRKFTEQSSNVDDKMYSALNVLENTIDNSAVIYMYIIIKNDNKFKKLFKLNFFPKTLITRKPRQAKKITFLLNFDLSMFNCI